MEKREKAQSVKAILDNHQKELNFVQEHGSERQFFLFLRRSESKLSECENALQSTLSETHQVKISLNKSQFPILADIGSVKVNETECPITYIPPKHYQTQLLMPIDLRLGTFELVDRVFIPDSVITGMAVTEDNKLLVCNRRGGIIVFDQNNKLCNTVEMTKSDPWDIAIIPDNSHKAAVTFDSNQIQFLNIQALQPGKVVTFNGKCSGIASTKDNIFVGSGGKILVLKFDGTLHRTISFSGHRIISFIHVDCKDRIYFIGRTQIKYITTDGKLLYSYMIDGETEHRNITTDHHGNVYIVCRKTNQIVRLTSDGWMDRVILNEDDAIDDPLALCFNKSCGKLYISNFRSEEILIYKCE